MNHIKSAISKRSSFLDPKHESAFRLFNGFVEGDPELVLDIYGKSLLLQDYSKHVNEDLFQEKIAQVQKIVLDEFPWIESVILKRRFSRSKEKVKGVYLFGEKATTWIRENGVRYSLDLCMNRDASFYLDTRLLRRWIKDNSKDKEVLNTFAYTGSLGVAAFAGGATRVVQSDLNKQFLNLAKTSHTLNGFTITKSDFQTGDFWKHMNILKRKGETFDIVIIDPPFFSETKGGKVDLAKSTQSMINKVRPLVKNGGKIVYINNALFVSGRELDESLNALCADGWLFNEDRIDVDIDFLGDQAAPITDPNPYNHSTKITVLQVKHR